MVFGVFPATGGLVEIQNEILPELYKTIKIHYEAKSYSNAIIDATKALTDLIRLKAKLDGDGISLVGQAFGGTTPPIKISPMRTTSETDEQKGFEQVLRGLYTGIRNPRTHENYKDKKNDCDAIIVFINYIYEKIENSRSFFELTEFKKRIFDPLFVEKSEYSELLVSEIPYEELVNTTDSILQDREAGVPEKLEYFFEAVFNKADPDQQKLIIKIFSNELKTAQTDSEIIGLIRHLDRKPKSWLLIDDAVKLRIENRIILSVKEGYLENDQVAKGTLGTWGNSLGQYFKLKNELARALIERLSPNWYTQNYIAKFYLPKLDSIIEGDYLIKECCENLAYAALGNNARLLKSELSSYFTALPKKWRELFLEKGLRYRDRDKNYFDNLQKMSDEEDLPF